MALDVVLFVLTSLSFLAGGVWRRKTLEMGSAVEKMAFQPPDTKFAYDLLQPDAPDTPLKFRPVRAAKQSKTTTRTSGAALRSKGISYLHLKHSTDVGSAAPLTLLWSHGNAEDLAYGFASYQKAFRSLRVDIVAYDYSGYGCSEGVPSEQEAYADVEDMYDYLTIDCRVPPERIVVVGRSLGSGPATHVASRHHDIGGLILLSPLASACSVVSVPLSGILSRIDIFNNRKKMPLVRRGGYPVLIVHGVKDAVVPFSHGQLLFNELTAPQADPQSSSSRCASPPQDDSEPPHHQQIVQSYWAERCGHNDIEAIEGERFYTRLRTFLKLVDERTRT